VWPRRQGQRGDAAAAEPRRGHGFFAGLDLVEPGLVQPPMWRPDPGRNLADEEENLDLVWFYAGVARKP
jgi:hypothetical protein